MNLWHAPRLLLRAHDCILQTGDKGHTREVDIFKTHANQYWGRTHVHSVLRRKRDHNLFFRYICVWLSPSWTTLSIIVASFIQTLPLSFTSLITHSSLFLYSIYSNAQHGMEWGNLDALPGSTALWGAWMCLWGPGHLVIFRVGFFGVGIWPYILSLEQRRSWKPRPLQTRMQESPLTKCNVLLMVEDIQ